MSKPFRARTLASLGALALAVLASCAEPTGVRMSRLSLLLTDAPGDVVAAVVTIDQVYLTPGAEGESGRLVIRDEDLTTDLLTLSDSSMVIVDSLLIPQGSYRQLRFVISGGYLEVENADGTTSIYASSPDYAGLPEGAVVAGPLQMPSFASSGLKVKLPGDLVEVVGNELWALVDFDVSQSFGHQAAASRWVMHPVITATLVAPPAPPPAP